MTFAEAVNAAEAGLRRELEHHRRAERTRLLLAGEDVDAIEEWEEAVCAWEARAIATMRRNLPAVLRREFLEGVIEAVTVEPLKEESERVLRDDYEGPTH